MVRCSTWYRMKLVHKSKNYEQKKESAGISMPVPSFFNLEALQHKEKSRWYQQLSWIRQPIHRTRRTN
eukprot:14525429-Ditylum_brightwellii.AAC.1